MSMRIIPTELGQCQRNMLDILERQNVALACLAYGMTRLRNCCTALAR